MPRVHSYRALFISDIHMSNKLPQAQLVADGVTDRLNDQLALWSRVEQTVKEAKPAATYILGDLFDKSLVDAVTLTATVEAITSLPGPKYILPGNHDAVSTSGGRFTVEAFGKMGRRDVQYIGARSAAAYIDIDDWLRFHPVEYSHTERALGAIRSANVAERPVNVLLLHHSILGCTHLGWTCDDGLDANEVCDGFDHVLSGHFHTPQMFGPDDKGRYLGAPMHHRMDDEGRAAGYWLVDFTSDGQRDETFVDGGAPLMWSAAWRGSAAKTRHEARPGDYLRVTVEATQPEWVAVRPAVYEYIERLKGEGIRASAKHRPIYHHSERLVASSVETSMTPEAMADAYVASADVDTNGLDVDLLKSIGRQALEEARRRMA